MAFCNFSLNLNIFNNCGLNNLFTPFSGFSFSGFNMPIFNCFNFSTFSNFNVPSLFNYPSYDMGNFMPYTSVDTFQSSDFGNLTQFNSTTMPNFTIPSFNSTGNLWNQVGMNFTPSWNTDTFSYSNTTRAGDSSSLRQKLVNNATSYIGKVNSDAEGNRLFSPNGRTQAWCADFVTYVTKKSFGNKLPSSFGSSSVSGLRDWAKSNNCYKSLPSSGKADFIKNNVKPGDIMIEKQGGKSHTGIVTKVNSDGSFETVEGNCSNKVKAMKYSANSSTLSGFISLKNYA